MLLQLPQLKSLVGVTDSQEDARLGSLLAVADSWVKSYCGRDFERRQYTEFYSGNNTQSLVLRHRPVKTVDEVRLDDDGYYGQNGGFDATTVLAEGTDYSLRLDNDEAGWSESGVLHRTGTVWPYRDRARYAARLTPEVGPARGNVRVTYTAGYLVTASPPNPEALPQGVAAAVAMLVAYWRRAFLFGGPVTREKLGRWEYEITPKLLGGVPGDVYGLLEPYREVAW